MTLWVVFSFLYISYSIFENFKTGMLQNIQNAYVQGKADTINTLIKQASDKECKPFNVFSDDKKVDLINISCLKQIPKETNSPVAPQK